MDIFVVTGLFVCLSVGSLTDVCISQILSRQKASRRK